VRFLLIRHSKYSVVKNTLLQTAVRRFCPLGSKYDRLFRKSRLL